MKAVGSTSLTTSSSMLERVSARALQMRHACMRLQRPAAGTPPPHQHRASHAHAQDPVRQGAPAASATVGATALAVCGGGRPCIFLVGGVLDIGAPITVSVVCIRAGCPHYRTTWPSYGRVPCRGSPKAGPMPSSWKWK